MEKNMAIQNGQRFLGDLRAQDATSGSLRTVEPSATPVEADNGGGEAEDTFISKLRGVLGTEEGKAAFNSAFDKFIQKNGGDVRKDRRGYANSFIQSLRDAYGRREKDDSWLSNAVDKDDVETTGPKAEDEYDESDYVTYTYKPGDTFGNVLLKTGLATDKGLWGSDGDVAYYNKQLVDTKLNPALGGKLSNIPVGTKIKLLKRGATPKSKK